MQIQKHNEYYPIVYSKLIGIDKELTDFEIIPNQFNYKDDVWDFSDSATQQGYHSDYKYKFNRISSSYKNYVKNAILRQAFIKENNFSTIKAKYFIWKKFIQHLDDNRVFHLNLIDKDSIETYLIENAKTERDLISKKTAIKELLIEFQANQEDLNYIEVYDYLNSYDNTKYQKERKLNKYHFIPKSFHTKVISLALKDLHNTTLSIEQKSVSAMLIIVAETGMRIGEFRILEIDKLETLNLDEEAESFSYLNFFTYKTVKKWTRTFMTKNAEFAYLYLSNTLSEVRGESKYLYISMRTKDIISGVSRLSQQLKEFYYRHRVELKEIGRLLPLYDEAKLLKWKIKETDLMNQAYNFLQNEDLGEEIYYANFHQFRVNLGTLLYEKGYHLDWIREHMNHLTSIMTEHYIRIEELRKVEQNAIEALLKRTNKTGSALETSTTLVDDKFIVEELNNADYTDAYNKINKFLKKNKYNLYKDMNQIISLLSKTDTPVMDLELGICAKALNKLCKRHEYISSIQDAYFIGVQIPSIEDLDFSYKRFLDKVKIIKYNEMLLLKNPKYRNEFEREVKGLNVYISKKLLPELSLLEEKIHSTGKMEMLSDFPTLESIINDLPNIIMEVKAWNQ